MSVVSQRPVLKIRDFQLGGPGRPKAIIPLTDAHEPGLIATARRVAASRADMVE